MSLLSVNTKIYGTVLLVQLKGELDHHTASELRNRVDAVMKEKAEVRHLVLNMRDLTFMDSSGLGVILGRYKEIERKKGQTVICSPNPMIYRLLEMAGMFKIISIKSTEEEALTELGVA